MRTRRCTAATRSGDRCKNESEPGKVLCAMHDRINTEHIEEAVQRLTDEAVKRLTPLAPPVSIHTDSLPILVVPRIEAANAQSPLVEVICAAAQRILDGEQLDDDALGLLLAVLVQDAGGSHLDMEFLIEASCAPDWTRGYFRALTPAGGASPATVGAREQEGTAS